MKRKAFGLTSIESASKVQRQQFVLMSAEQSSPTVHDCCTMHFDECTKYSYM